MHPRLGRDGGSDDMEAGVRYRDPLPLAVREAIAFTAFVFILALFWIGGPMIEGILR